MFTQDCSLGEIFNIDFGIKNYYENEISNLKHRVSEVENINNFLSKKNKLEENWINIYKKFEETQEISEHSFDYFSYLEDCIDFDPIEFRNDLLFRIRELSLQFKGKKKNWNKLLSKNQKRVKIGNFSYRKFENDHECFLLKPLKRPFKNLNSLLEIEI